MASSDSLLLREFCHSRPMEESNSTVPSLIRYHFIYCKGNIKPRYKVCRLDNDTLLIKASHECSTMHQLDVCRLRAKDHVRYSK